VSINFREAFGVGIVVGAAKGGETGVGKSLGGFRGREGLQELEGDLGFEVAEEVEGEGEVAEEDGLEAVGESGDRLGEGVDEIQLGLHLTDQFTVGLPGGEAVSVSAKEVGDEESVGRVIVGAGGSVTATAGGDDTGRDDKDLKAARPEEVDDEVVSGFQSDEAIRSRDIQLGDLAFQLGEALDGVREGETSDLRSGLVHDTSVVYFFGPINTDQDAHGIPPFGNDSSVDASFCEPVKALEGATSF
jgi:hypothetical protein